MKRRDAAERMTWMRIEAMKLMADALMTGWLVRRDFARGEAWLRRPAKLDPTDYFAPRNSATRRRR